MHMTVKRQLSAALAATILFLTACDQNAKEWKTPNMTALTPRLQSMFEKTKTVCFGRFMVDVPASVTVVWGGNSIPLGVTVFPNGVQEVNAAAQKFIDELKDGKAIYHDDASMLISVDDLTQPKGKIVTGYDSFSAISTLKINGYFSMNNDGVIIEALPMKDMKDQVIVNISSIARRLRHRAEAEVPVEPGNCIEYAFLPDEPGMPTERRNEHIRIGFRLKEFPDTHLSIAIRPSNPHFNESNTLEWQLQRLEKNLRAENPNHPRLNTAYFRRGRRQIHEWTEGFEALSRSPDQADIHGIHDFGMDFQGVPYDPLKPYADIRMQTGVADNAAGAIKPSLTDEEAIAVWDKITSTIRVRPTGAAVAKIAGTNPEPRFPLGELAATGRTCPQTGMWESSEPSIAEGGQRRYIKAGDIMPRVTAPGKPSIWQKLKGERPVHALATVWKLVGYGDVPGAADKTAQTPSIAQVLPASGALNDAAGNSIGDSPSGDASPKEQG